MAWLAAAHIRLAQGRDGGMEERCVGEVKAS